MRVELLYAPGCTTYQKALNVLQIVIAEERLPLPVELVEDGHESTNMDAPQLRIDGEIVDNKNKLLQSVEAIRDLISEKWSEMAVHQLVKLT